MHYVMVVFALFVSSSTHTAELSVWPEMHEKKKNACFRAKELNAQGVICRDDTETDFKHLGDVAHKGLYKDFYKNGECADVIVGTACVGFQEYQDVFLPSYKQVTLLLESLQSDIERFLTQKKVKEPNAWECVLGLYAPGAALGMEQQTPYVKIPYTNEGLTDRPIMRYVQEIPKVCFIFNDAFSTGLVEFNALRLLLDEVLPRMTDDQKKTLRIGVATVYFSGDCHKTVRCFYGGNSRMHVVDFQGNLQKRLLTCAQLHLLSEFLEQPENHKITQRLYDASEEEKDKTLQAILRITRFQTMAYERYTQYVLYSCCKAHVNDFHQKGWIDETSAKTMQVVLPHMSASAHKGLDLQPIADYLLANKGVRHILEPIFYLPDEHMMLCTPLNHAAVSQERTGSPHTHEVPILTLKKDSSGCYHVEDGWTRCCQGLLEWDWVDCAHNVKQETVGVILLDPYDNTQTRLHPTRESHPHLLEDVMAAIEMDLKIQGFNVLFLQLFPDGRCQDTCGKAYPSAKPKSPICNKLLSDTVHVVWDNPSHALHWAT